MITHAHLKKLSINTSYQIFYKQQWRKEEACKIVYKTQLWCSLTVAWKM